MLRHHVDGGEQLSRKQEYPNCIACRQRNSFALDLGNDMGAEAESLLAAAREGARERQ
jgi:hypothetical protein